jgi:hypothetical protein
MRLWYARRGISWVPLLACLCLALTVVPLGHRWPDSLGVLLPAALALCAAACGFVFDEAAAAVVSVTPRGAGWRRTTRCFVAALPALVWVLLVARLDGARVDRTGWLLAGLGTQLVALGLAALASRREVGAPGSTVASVLVVLTLMPLVIGPIAGWEPVLPLGTFPGWVTAFWAGAALLGAGLLARAVRPRLR